MLLPGLSSVIVALFGFFSAYALTLSSPFGTMSHLPSLNATNGTVDGGNKEKVVDGVMSEPTKRNAASLWRQPTGNGVGCNSKLYLTNSLTRKKEIFIPQSGNHVSFSFFRLSI